MAGDAIFKVAADVAEFVSGMARAEQATKKVAKSTASIGDQITGSIVKVELLNRALNAAGRAISGVLDKAQGASKSAGDRAIGMAADFASLGVRDITGMTRRATISGGMTTPEQGAGLVRGLVSANRQRRQGLKENEIGTLLDAAAQLGEAGFGTGFEDLLSGVSEGSEIGSMLKKARARAESVRVSATDPMSPLYQGMRGRAAEVNAQNREESAFLVSGTTERVARAGARITAANDPGGPVSIISGAVGEGAGTFVDRAMKSLVGGGGNNPDPLQNLGQSIQRLSETIRASTISPNFATDTP